MNLLTLESVLTQLVAWVKSLFVQPDYAQNDSAQPDFIKNRTHYVEISTSSVWNQTGCSVGSGTTSPGGYPATFNITIGNKYNVTISQDSTSKTYEGLTAEYDSDFNGIALRKNWSDSTGMSDTDTDAVLLVVQPSNVVLRSADIYGENCTVQVSEITETIHKLDPKYLPDNVNQLDSITTSKSGKVTTVTFEQTNGTETQFQVTDGEDGTNGKSAYQVAVDNGYSGTEAQWLASLKGADGVSLGEVELVQQLSQDDDKVPSAKAVQDGIEVWRDDIEGIYRASELTFDGTNYVDTGWNPYNPEGDFYIKMEISDLNLAGTVASGIIIGCVKQVDPYPGFAIRKESNTTINVWLDGMSRWPTTVNTGTGSKNTIIFTRKGDVYTFQVNGGTKNTFTSTTNNTDALNLYIGSGLNANNRLWRFGKFYLDSLEIILEQSTQLYGDYTKDVVIYPKTTIGNVRGLPSQLNNISFGAGWSTPTGALYFKLSPAQVGKLNQTDGITIFTSAKVTSGNPYNYRYAKFFEARKYASNNYSTVDTNGLRVAFNYSHIPIVNGVTFTNGLSYMNIAIEVNKRLGRVRIWNEGYMIEEKFDDAFKTDYFVDNDGVFVFDRGDYDKIWYNYQLYSGEIITDWERTDPFKVIGASTPAKTFMNGYTRQNFTDALVFGPAGYVSNRYYRILGGSTITKASDSSYADFVNTGAATNELGGRNMAFSCLTISITPFDVNEGTFRAFKNYPDGNGTKQGSAYVYYRNQDGTQGEEIEDYDNIGQGQYLFVGNSFGVYTSPFLRQVTYPSSIRVYPKTFIFPGCLLDVRMDILYNNRFKDYVSNEDFIMYSNNTLTTEFVPDITTEKADALINTNFSLSKFPGRMSMHDNNVYMLVHNPTTGTYTWKQINNS